MLKKLGIGIVIGLFLAAFFLPEVVKAEELPPRTIVVQSGDTLAGLADQYSNNWALYPELMAANGLTTTVIFPGQELIVPQSWPAYYEAFNAEELGRVHETMGEPWDSWVFQSAHGGAYQLVRDDWIPFKNPAGWWPGWDVIEGQRCFDASKDFVLYPLGIEWDSHTRSITIQRPAFVPRGECSISYQSWEKETVPVTVTLTEGLWEGDDWWKFHQNSTYYDSRERIFYTWDFVPYLVNNQLCLAIFTLDDKQMESLPSLPENFGEEYELGEEDGVDPSTIEWVAGEPATVTNIYYTYGWEEADRGSPWRAAVALWQGTELEYRGKSYLFTGYYDLDLAHGTVTGIDEYRTAGMSVGGTWYGEIGRTYWISAHTEPNDVQLRDTPPFEIRHPR